MTTLCFDYDSICFRAAAATETRSISAINKSTKEVLKFDNRTTFYGRDRKKSGGWLGNQPNLKLDDFDIEDVIEPAPLSVCLYNIDSMIQAIVDKYKGRGYFGYIGGSGNFRKEICTLLPYKGNRKDTILPVHLEAARQYVIRKHGAIIVNGKEADDLLCQTAYEEPDYLCVGLDKDYMGCDGTWYNFVTDELTKVKGFGKLERIQKDNGTFDVKGTGRLWKYFQVCYGDSADNYDPACFTEVKNGPKKVWSTLEGCTSDKEAFIAMQKHFLSLYPEPKEITNWRGDTFTIDWLYVMQEMFDMAHLQRYDDDRIIVVGVMKKLGLEI